MTLYEILVDFPGSQDGTHTEQFKAGTQRELSDWLAAAVVPQGWARPVAEKPQTVENKAVVTEGRQTGTMKRVKK